MQGCRRGYRTASAVPPGSRACPVPRGQPARAIETVDSIGFAAPTEIQKRSPRALAVTAMASQKLGDSARAQRTLDELRKLVQSPEWVHNQEAQILFREAENVIFVASSARITLPGK